MARLILLLTLGLCNGTSAASLGPFAEDLTDPVDGNAIAATGSGLPVASDQKDLRHTGPMPVVAPLAPWPRSGALPKRPRPTADVLRP